MAMDVFLAIFFGTLMCVLLSVGMLYADRWQSRRMAAALPADEDAEAAMPPVG
jgi:hypothetical protein